MYSLFPGQPERASSAMSLLAWLAKASFLLSMLLLLTFQLYHHYSLKRREYNFADLQYSPLRVEILRHAATGFFYEEPLHKKPTCRRPENLKSLCHVLKRKLLRNFSMLITFINANKKELDSRFLSFAVKIT